MSFGARGALARLRHISGEALRRVTLWAVGAFGASALLVALVAWLAGGAISTPSLLGALALGAAVGWAAGLTALTQETLRLLETVVEASVAASVH